MKKVKGPTDVPKGRHYVVLIYKTDSVTIPGDERSRTHPGHGYPEHTQEFTTFEQHVTEDRADWEAFIAKMVQPGKKVPDFVCFEVAGLAQVRTDVTVSVGR